MTTRAKRPNKLTAAESTEYRLMGEIERIKQRMDIVRRCETTRNYATFLEWLKEEIEYREVPESDLESLEDHD